MPTSDFSIAVRSAIMAMGFSEDIANLVHLDRVESYEEGAPARGLITIGYITKRAGKDHRNELASVNISTLCEAIDYACDRDRIGTLICLGMRAMPSDIRPELPEWFDQGDADRVTRDLRRAGKIADLSARGVKTENARVDADAPF